MANKVVEVFYDAERDGDLQFANETDRVSFMARLMACTNSSAARKLAKEVKSKI